MCVAMREREREREREELIRDERVMLNPLKEGCRAQQKKYCVSVSLCASSCGSEKYLG